MSKKQIVEEIHKQARKNFRRRHVILKGIDDLWQADLIDVKSFYRQNKGCKFILVVIDAFSKYAWAKPLKTKSKEEVTSRFLDILKCGRSPVNLQTDQGTEFYNQEFQKLLKSYNINHYSTFSVKKASIVERLIKTLKNKLYKYFSLVGNYKWVGKPLNDVINSYNYSKHRTIGLKPIEVNQCNESSVLNHILRAQKLRSPQKSKFKVGDYVRVSKYKSCFDKGYTPNWSTEIFQVKTVNKTNPITYNLQDTRHQLIKGCFYEKELLRSQYPDLYLIEKVIKKKGNKLFVKWLGLDEKENSWINRNDII